MIYLGEFYRHEGDDYCASSIACPVHGALKNCLFVMEPTAIDREAEAAGAFRCPQCGVRACVMVRPATEAEASQTRRLLEDEPQRNPKGTE